MGIKDVMKRSKGPKGPKGNNFKKHQCDCGSHAGGCSIGCACGCSGK